MLLLAEPLTVQILLLIVLLDNDLFSAAQVDLLERDDVGFGQVAQKVFSLRSCCGCVLYREFLKKLALLANHARQLKPAITGFVWHSVAPKSFQD